MSTFTHQTSKATCFLILDFPMVPVRAVVPATEPATQNKNATQREDLMEAPVLGDLVFVASVRFATKTSKQGSGTFLYMAYNNF